MLEVRDCAVLSASPTFIRVLWNKCWEGTRLYWRTVVWWMSENVSKRLTQSTVRTQGVLFWFSFQTQSKEDWELTCISILSAQDVSLVSVLDAKLQWKVSLTSAALRPLKPSMLTSLNLKMSSSVLNVQVLPSNSRNVTTSRARIARNGTVCCAEESTPMTTLTTSVIPCVLLFWLISEVLFS